jgi:hypothetical protein
MSDVRGREKVTAPSAEDIMRLNGASAILAYHLHALHALGAVDERASLI